jgi:hypothetical protein
MPTKTIIAVSWLLEEQTFRNSSLVLGHWGAFLSTLLALTIELYLDISQNGGIF